MTEERIHYLKGVEDVLKILEPGNQGFKILEKIRTGELSVEQGTLKFCQIVRHQL